MRRPQQGSVREKPEFQPGGHALAAEADLPCVARCERGGGGLARIPFPYYCNVGLKAVAGDPSNV